MEPLLQRLKDDLSPERDASGRVRDVLSKRIGQSPVFERAKAAATPSDDTRGLVWSHVLRQIESPAGSLLGRIGTWLQPSEQNHRHLFVRLQPVPLHSTAYTRTKWVAAFALVVLGLRASPVLFLAPRSVAESAVLFIPTGSAQISLHELWQPVTQELTLSEPVAVSGQSTIVLHDDGTVRLDSDASVHLYDLSDRPEPALDVATLSLESGRIWVQGLLPSYVRGLTVATPAGDLVVHDGSVSIELAGTAVIVRVWDHSATMQQGDQSTVLVTGEQARFGERGSAGEIIAIPESLYDDSWVKQNLERDAVHQRAVAQMQRERSAAKAGILPNSPFYSVKRVAEQVDVLLTLDPAVKLQKQIDLASTRLNEAVALVNEGGTGAEVSLEEYRLALQAIASGSGGNSTTQFLLRQEVTENVTDLSAAEPTDDLYALKKAVLEASAELPVDVVNTSQVQSILLVDTLDALQEAIASGDTESAKISYDALVPYLPLLASGGAVTAEGKKEAMALIVQTAGHLEGEDKGLTTIEQIADGIRPFLPVQEPVPVVVTHLSDEEVATMASRILVRIDRFNQPRPRLNQLILEIKELQDHPDAARILRQLYHMPPPEETALTQEVRRAIQDLR